jgi:hypothetical protein
MDLDRKVAALEKALALANKNIARLWNWSLKQDQRLEALDGIHNPVESPEGGFWNSAAEAPKTPGGKKRTERGVGAAGGKRTGDTSSKPNGSRGGGF